MSNIPEVLTETIDRLTSSLKEKELKELTQDLSNRYREQGLSHSSEGHRLAYLITRMPATYASIETVLAKIKEKALETTIESLLDVGAGPGTGMWASKEEFPEITQATLLERDSAFIRLGKQLAASSDCSIKRSAVWKECDLKRDFSALPHDLVLMSYAIGEIPEEGVDRLLEILWGATKKVFAVIEPGTPKGFQKILRVRQKLISLGAHIIAPCPHHHSCPLQSKNDWCHFYARLSRSSQHRRIKEGSLNYEDEKFSYLIVSKNPLTSPPTGCILRHPLKKPGHIQLTICTETGIKETIISRKDKEQYLKARKLNWGNSVLNQK